MDSHAVSTGEVSECNIQVFVRIRPPSEEEPSYSRVVDCVDEKTISIKQGQNPRLFRYDQVVNVDARQETIFSKLGKNVIENCISGYNGTIFAYGQTGSGKTFTMLGPAESTEDFQDEKRGVIPRSFDYLFSMIRKEKELHGENKQFLCKCSFLEIYNEQIFDLMEPSSSSLHLRENLKHGVYVNGLSEAVVCDAAEAFQALNSSWINRRVASTSMNRESSRSHAVFTLTIESKEWKDGAWVIKTSQLNLVDLAGSESQKNTNATGLRLKEAGSINKSLSNLGNVINALSGGSRDGKERFVPYRDSKLTFLLRASLGGNAKTSLIACVHSGHKYYSETLSTLQFAQRAKMIKNKAMLNENAQLSVQQLLVEIKSLKEQLAAAKSGSGPVQEPSTVEGAAPVGEPAEPMPELKRKFMRAMAFYQRAEMEKMELENELAESKRLSDKAVRQKVMIIKFREDAIKRLENKIKGKEETEGDKTLEQLKEENKMLREENTNHPEVKTSHIEIQRLKRQIRNMKASEDWSARAERDHMVAKDLEQTFKKLVTEQKMAENEEFPTPQRTDMTSTATLDKLRSHNKDLMAEVELLKQSISEAKEEMEKKEKQYKNELEEYAKTVKDLEKTISANNLRTKIEKEEMTKKHLEAVITITTPKKERYKLRSRTVVSDSPLNDSIPFEDPTGAEAAASDGIMEEEAPDFVFEQRNDAFCEQIKQQQEQISDLQSQICEMEKARIQMSQTISHMESALAQTKEDQDKDKSKELATKEKIIQLENTIRDNAVKMSCDLDEINDLRMVLNSADNELKEVKKKYKLLSDSASQETEQYSNQIVKLERRVEEMEKNIEKSIEEKEELKNDLDKEKSASLFHSDLCQKLEEMVNEKTKEIEQLNAVQKNMEEKIMSTEGIHKENLSKYLEQCDEITKLKNDNQELQEKLRISHESEENTRKIYEQAQTMVDMANKEKEKRRSELEEMQFRNSELMERLSIQENEIEEMKTRTSNLENDFKNTQLNLHEKDEELKRAMESLESVYKLREENEQLEKTVASLHTLANKDREERVEIETQLQNHTTTIKTLMEENKTLLEQNTDLTIKTLMEENKTLLEQNTDLVGHSNHKQKIKYHEKLKDENLQLKKDLQGITAKYHKLLDEHKMSGESGPTSLLQENRGKENKPQQRLFFSGDYTSKKS